MSKIPTDPVIEAVRADLLRRQQHGFLKYGGILAENPAGLKGALQHAYEEALDLANYLKWSIMLLNRDPAIRPDPTHNTGLKTSRRRCESGITNAEGMCVVCFADEGTVCLSPAADPR